MERVAEDRLMTVKQLADYLRVNDRTVLKLVSDGTLPGVKVGNQWRFRKAMIDTWLDDQVLGVTPKFVDPPRPIGSPQAISTGCWSGSRRACPKPSPPWATPTVSAETSSACW